MGRLFSCLILFFFGFGLLSCSSSKQSGDGETSDANAETNEEGTDDTDANTEEDPFAPLLEAFASALSDFAEACKTETIIQAPEYNFYTGFTSNETDVTAGLNTFTNIAGVLLSCNSDQTALIAAQDDIIAELGAIDSSIEQQAKLEEVMTFFAEQFGQTGLQAHFESALASTTVTLGEGLTKREDFLFNEGIVFLIAATFDAGAAGASTVTFTYGDQVIESVVNVTDYTTVDLAAGKARYDMGAALNNNAGTSQACANCHALPTGTDHSPLKIGTCSDAEIVGAVSNGAYTADATNPDSFCAGYVLSSVAHSWDFDSPEQMASTIAYLRTLPLPLPPGTAAE